MTRVKARPSPCSPRPSAAAEASWLEDEHDVDEEHDEVDGPLQHVGAHGAEGEHADDEGQQENDDLARVEPELDVQTREDRDDDDGGTVRLIVASAEPRQTFTDLWR